MQLNTLDNQQLFAQLQIQTQEKRIHLNNVTFEDSMQRLQQVVDSMRQSHFYKNITVHLGAKTNHNIIYLQEHYQNRISLLKLQLQQQKQYLKDIITAVDQDELEIKQLEHRKNQLYIQDKKRQIKHQDFHPCLFVKADRKKPIYGQITQEFTKKGIGNFVAKLGYRAPFRTYDTIELDLEWPISTSFRSYYQAYVNWSNRTKWGVASLRVGGSRQPTFNSIDFRSNSFSLGLQRQKERFEVEVAHRKPYVHQNIFEHMKNGFYQPSRKFSLKYHRTLFNTIKFQDVTNGQYAQAKAQLGLPLLGQATFLRMECNFRKFVDTFGARKWVQHPWLMRLLWKSSMEINVSGVALAQFGKKRYISDVLQSIDARGFQPLRQPRPSYANLKSSVKFNIHNYPLLSQARIVSFLYGQTGLSFLKQRPFYSPLTLFSTGLGISFYATPSAQIEVLCNLAQWQSAGLREPVGFQVRFGIFD